jgi:hypothetical protein
VAAGTSPSTAAAVGTIAITQEKIPAGAVILGGFVEVDTAVTSAARTPRPRSRSRGRRHRRRGGRLGRAVVDDGPQERHPGVHRGHDGQDDGGRDISIVIAAAALTAAQFDVVLFYVHMGD